MSGHFVVWDLKVQDQVSLQTIFGAAMQQGFVNADPHVWNTETQSELQKAMSGDTGITREKMPSHAYIHIKNPPDDACGKARMVIDTVTDRLVRPPVGLKQLVPDAQQAFDRGDKMEAFLIQAQHSTATIEYYYVSGQHV
ncbi:hypothetical protein [Vannielia litorea]|uniref:hypothetical protein n=1 Tax=Vannielia litorea TaxID=1217970 RepID=UPI001BCEA616|nr:hypothetical protein [Vannielia litorea]MBS8225583.1 hypothetical protein [Vannielia litorea]